MTRWKLEPLKWSGLPEGPVPFSPVHSARKFSAVLGTTSARSVISMRPAGWPPIVMSKYTTGFDLRARARADKAARRESVSRAREGGFASSTYIVR